MDNNQYSFTICLSRKLRYVDVVEFFIKLTGKMLSSFFLLKGTAVENIYGSTDA